MRLRSHALPFVLTVSSVILPTAVSCRTNTPITTQTIDNETDAIKQKAIQALENAAPAHVVRPIDQITEDVSSSECTDVSDDALEFTSITTEGGMVLRVPPGNILQEGFVQFIYVNDEGTTQVGLAAICSKDGRYFVTLENGDALSMLRDVGSFEVSVEYITTLPSQFLKSVTLNQETKKFEADATVLQREIDPEIIEDAIQKMLQSEADKEVIEMKDGVRIVLKRVRES